MQAIEIKELVKKYGDFTAVSGVSFDVKKGEIFGFSSILLVEKRRVFGIM